MRPFLIFQEAATLQGRQWVLEAEPQQIHDEVCALTRLSTDFPVEIGVMRAQAGKGLPAGTDDAAEAAIAFLSAGISSAAKPWLWRLRASTINVLAARIGGEGWPLSSPPVDISNPAICGRAKPGHRASAQAECVVARSLVKEQEA